MNTTSDFLAAFKKDCVAQEATPGNHILALFDPEAKALIGSMTVEDLLNLKEEFVERMNEALALPAFYNAAAWQRAKPSGEAASLLEAGSARELTPEEVLRMNRLLLEAAYPGHIRPAVTAAPEQ